MALQLGGAPGPESLPCGLCPLTVGIQVPFVIGKRPSPPLPVQ